jgi:hypothetical protein
VITQPERRSTATPLALPRAFFTKSAHDLIASRVAQVLDLDANRLEGCLELAEIAEDLIAARRLPRYHLRSLAEVVSALGASEARFAPRSNEELCLCQARRLRRIRAATS